MTEIRRRRESLAQKVLALPHGRLIAFGLGAVAVIAWIYLGLLLLSALTRLIASLMGWNIQFPVVPAKLLPGVVSQSQPSSQIARIAKEARINILVMGLDTRPDEKGAPTRTDTMLIFTLDAHSKTAGLLSIPRDLWVDIPVSDKNVIKDRINAANVYGEIDDYPGGGPALAMATIEKNIGVHIDYYLMIDFDGFKGIIDTLGGVTVTLDEPLIDNEYPTPDYGTMRIYLPAGTQKLNGEKALWYARSRHQDSDFGRMKHQQNLLMAIRKDALRIGIIPKLPQLYSKMRSTFKTDLSIAEITELARLTKDIDSENIVGETLGTDYVDGFVTSEGADVLAPRKEKIRELVRGMFYDSQLREEGATVQVLNGTPSSPLAAKVAEYLINQGLTKVTYGNIAGTYDKQETMIIDYTGKEYTAWFISDVLKLSDAKIERREDPTADVDLRVILGKEATFPKEAAKSGS
ncbi:MAG: LCP family protein [Chloroflexi bacterium]|nr:LCP family protein [Chloroflexota bacterium]